MSGSYQLYRCAVMSTSTGSLDSVLDRDSPIQILRLTIHTDAEYTDGLDLKPEAFYRWLYQNPGKLPQTSPPSVESLRTTFQHLKAQGYHSAIVTTLSSRFSESHANICRVAAEMAGELDIHVVDTGMAGMPEGFFALEALRLLKAGHTPVQVLAELERLKPCCEIIFSVHSLDQLANSGGLSRAGAVFGNLLQRKPVLCLRHNQLQQLDAASASDDVLDATVAAVAKRLVGKNRNDLVLCGLYGGDHALYQRFAAKLHSATGLHLAGISISPVLGAYIGPDAVGVGIVDRSCR